MAEEQSEKARRRAARQLVGEHHERELARLREHCARASLGSTRANSTRSTSNRAESVAWAIEDAQSREDDIDWWAAGEPRRRRSDGR